MVLPYKRNGHQTEWALELASSKALLSECVRLCSEVWGHRDELDRAGSLFSGIV